MTLASSYQPRRPTETVLYGAVRQHLETFLAHAEESYAAPLPRYVQDELRGYLRCGVFAHGFVRARCDTLRADGNRLGEVRCSAGSLPNMNPKTSAASIATWSVAFALFGGCNGNALSVSDYNTSCTVASDCVAVSIDTVCKPCTPPDAAINIADQDRYNADFSRVSATCGAPRNCMAAYNQHPASCTAGKCTY